jgi:HSP90 family molecular chaperone
VDEWLLSTFTEFEGKKLQSIAKGDLDLGKLEDDKEKEKRQRTGQTLEEITRVLILTEEEERDLLYTQNKKWINYSAQITKLTQYIKKFADEPATIFTREEYNTLLGNNPKTKLLIGYFKKYLKDNAVKEDEAMNVFHFASIQNESIIVDAINFVISYQNNVDEWETFLGSTPEDLDIMDIKVGPGIGSKLHTFPADASPLIYDLTRRLEALQAW